MPYQVMIVEGSEVPAEASVRTALGADPLFSCRHLACDAFTPASLQQADASMLIAVAVPQTPQVMRLFEWLRDHPIPLPTVAVLADGADSYLRDIASASAADFIYCPLRPNELRHRLQRLLRRPRAEIVSVRQRLTEQLGLTHLVGESASFQDVIEQLRLIARADAAVLITGETGTGKELCARAIHHLGARRPMPFIAVDCASIPDHLFENELFGHARGAFTDAHREQKGLIGMAEGGTLFLDEVDALSVPAQGKLLRFLQERCFRPLGSDRFAHANVNIVAATNRDLEDAVRAKVFRADLFFRLNVLRLHLPPLRERAGDVPLLARHFVESLNGGAGARHKMLSPTALSKLGAHQWPGNVRELANVIQRAVVMSPTEWISGDHIALVERPVDAAPSGARSAATFRGARAETVAAFERGYVADLLRRHNGNVTHAAREADKDRRAFGRLVKKYGIDRYNP